MTPNDAATLADDQPATQFPPLDRVNCLHVPTDQAAHYLNRRPQTLRIYAMTGHPIRPVRFNGRLAWPVSEIKRLMGVTA